MLPLYYDIVTILAAALTLVYFSAILSKSTLYSVILTGFGSLLCVLLYCLLKAPDVAITEVAVNSAISTIFALFTITVVEKEKITNSTTSTIPNILAPLLLFVLLVCAFYNFEDFGNPNSIANLGVGDLYIRRTALEFDVKNIVTAVLGSFRGFDTLMETTVIFSTAIGIKEILKENKTKY